MILIVAHHMPFRQFCHLLTIIWKFRVYTTFKLQISCCSVWTAKVPMFFLPRDAYA